MGVPTSEVGYTPAMPRREDHEVHKGHVVALEEKKTLHYTVLEVNLHVCTVHHQHINILLSNCAQLYEMYIKLKL